MRSIAAMVVCVMFAPGGVVPAGAQSNCAAADRLDRELQQFERDVDADVRSFVTNESAKASLRAAKDLMAGSPTAQALFAVRQHLAEFSAYAEFIRVFSVAHAKYVACNLSGRPGCAMEMGGQNEAHQRYLELRLGGGAADASRRARAFNDVLQRTVPRALGTAQTSMLSAVMNCDALFEQRVVANTTAEPVQVGGTQTTTANSGGGGGGGSWATWLGLMAGAVAVPLALMPEEVLDDSTTTATTTTTPSAPTTTSNTSASRFNGTYRAVVNWSCSGGFCVERVPTSGCHPYDFTFTLSNGTVQDPCGLLTGSVNANGVFTGIYGAQAFISLTGQMTSAMSLSMSGSAASGGSTYSVRVEIVKR